MSLQDNQDKALTMWANILSKEALQNNIILTSLFVLFFETLKDFLIDRPLSFYCCDSCEMKDGKIVYKENDTYKREVRALEKSKILHASVQWFQKQGALSEEEANQIYKAGQRRDVFVHEFLNFLSEGWREDDSSLLVEIISLYHRLDSWWSFNFEFDEDEVPNPETVTQKDCYSLHAAVLQVVKDVILGNDKQYSGWMEEIREAVQRQRAKNPATTVSQSKSEKQEVEND